MLPYLSQHMMSTTLFLKSSSVATLDEVWTNFPQLLYDSELAFIVVTENGVRRQKRLGHI